MANVKWSSFTSGGDLQVGDQVVGLRAGDNRRFTFPSVGIKDAAGNYLLGWESAASAVNYIIVSNAATGTAPFIIPTGTDVDIDLLLKSKGNGNIVFTPGGTGHITASAQLLLSTSSPSTALEAASKGYVDSVIPTFPISLAHGGTSAALVASNGGIFYSTATAGAILSGTATANQVLLSGSSAAPSWSTATYPATTTVSQLLYSSSSNVITGLATGNNGLLITSATGVPSILAGSGVTGNMLHSNAAAAPSWSTAVYADTYTVNNILYASSANSVMGLATANNGVLITSALGVPSISSTLPAAVQGNITSLGTVTSGVWNGTVITGQYGGTGVNNGSSTITLGGSLTTSGAFASTFTMTGITNVTFPTSGTLATTSQLPTLPLSLANGGTNKNNTASNGGIVYSSASDLSILPGTATANQVVLSGSNTTPSWSTATYPATTTINQLLYSSAANTIVGLATANSASLVTNASGVPAWSATMTDGQVVIGATSGTPTPATLTAGSGITITNAAHSITIASSATSMPAGSMIPFAGTALPSGWLACDGSAVSRTTYAALFTAIGTTWGSGDGSTTFNVPNMQRRTAVGSGGSGTGVLGNAVGNTGGSETITLSIGQIPSHTHSTVGGTLLTGKSPGDINIASSTVNGSATSGPAGSGSAHDNIQPSAIVMYIIKT